MKDLVRIADLPTNKEGRVIEVGLTYSLGGMNYFGGTVDPRGYFLYARPAEVKGNGLRSIAMFHGVKDRVAEASRFSQKKMDALLAEYTLEHPRVVRMVELVRKGYGGELLVSTDRWVRSSTCTSSMKMGIASGCRSPRSSGRQKRKSRRC